MKLLIIVGVLIAASFAARAAWANDAAAKKELTPTGKLRVAIAVGPAPSGIYVIKDEASGKYRGVTIDLSAALAKKLGVEIDYIPYLASGEIQGSASPPAAGRNRHWRPPPSARRTLRPAPAESNP